MSWGERSCKRPCIVPEECSMSTCNVNCRCYSWNEDSEVMPDSKPKCLIGKGIDQLQARITPNGNCPKCFFLSKCTNAQRWFRR